MSGLDTLEIKDWQPDSPGWLKSPLGLYVPEAAMVSALRRRRWPIAIDLFCGAGGASIGVHQAGFQVIAALDSDPLATITYCMNLAQPGLQFHFDTPEHRAELEKALEKHLGINGKKDRKSGLARITGVAGSGWISHYGCEPGDEDFDYVPTHPNGCEHFWYADIRNVTGQEILDTLGLQQGEVDLVVGGPPCQGFSIAGKRNIMDPRNSLVFEFARLVLEIRPKSVVMENVPGIVNMTTPEGLPVVDAFCRILEDGGFGTVDGLKKSLLSTAGLGAMLRGKPKMPKGTARARLESETDDDGVSGDRRPSERQTELFEAVNG